MFGSAAICLCGTIFILIFLPETKKNKCYDDIMKALENWGNKFTLMIGANKNDTSVDYFLCCLIPI